MMKVIKLTGCAGLLVLLPVLALIAKNPATDLAGGVAAENTSATRAFGAGNSTTPNAPAVFRDCSMTNAIAKEFLAEFAGARSSFMAAVQDTFHQPMLDEKAVAAPDFGYLITAFNIEHKEFPVSSELAAGWARGESCRDVQSKLLDLLLQAARHSIRPDTLPAGFAHDETCCLVPAGRPDQELTAGDIERGKLVALASISTIAEARELFRRGFSTDEQPLARAVSQLLEPNCIPDAGLTQWVRDRASSSARTPAAPEQLAGLTGNNLAQSLPVTPEQTPTQGVKSHKQPVKVPGPVVWILAAVSVVSAAASMALWQKRKSTPPPVRAIKYSPHTSVLQQPELAPIVAAVKETFIQELALQRRELIIAQQQAAAEIVELIRRLDKLQMPMQERLMAYENEIQRLEKELADRTKENRELIKMRIELTRQQLETERAGNRAEFN